VPVAESKTSCDATATSPPQSGWPLLAEEALYGLAGEIVTSVDPYTEADPVAVLIHLLAGFGNLLGPGGPYFRVEFTKHSPRLFAVLVGESSKGRKGQSWSTPRHLLSEVDSTWRGRITSGLSSGEGLIYAVRDGGDLGRGEIDPGSSDKRLFVVEEEFAQALKVMRREGNILSAVIRDAWDHGDLRVLTKNNRVEATGAYISIVGHITRDELLRYLNATEQANGFANRFIWSLVRRSKVIPDPKGIPPVELSRLIDRLRTAFTFAQGSHEVTRDAEAAALWAEVYASLSEGRPGLLGGVLNRAEAQVMRVALIYALLDRSPQIRPEHLKAALAVWDYVESSARWIFGARLGDPTADTILAALRDRGEMSETDLHTLFGRNIQASEMNRALDLIQRLKLAHATPVSTGGRHRIVWRVTK
jgi:hypothetical protein